MPEFALNDTLRYHLGMFTPAIKKIITSLLLTGMLFCFSNNSFARDESPISYFAPTSNGTALTIDYSPYAKFLKQYVSTNSTGLNVVDYAHVSASDKKQLNNWIAQLAKIDIRHAPRTTQLAFWLNLYNALTVQLILNHYPVASIKAIKFSLFSPGPWGSPLISVADIPLSLDDIEHRIIRAYWHTPLVHFGANCASIGCPNLLKTPFLGATVTKQLQAAAIAYINNPRGITSTKKGLILSKIFIWYKSDFGKDDAALLATLAGYAKPTLKKELMGKPKIAGSQYDWHLNEKK